MDAAPGAEAGAAPSGEGSELPEVPSLFRRLLDVFVAPGDLFEILRARPVWVGALLLGGGLVLASFLVLPTELYVEMAREQIRQMGEGAEGAPGAETMALFMRFGGAVGALVGWFIFAAILAGIVTLVFGLVLGDEGRFKQYLSVAAHGLLIVAVGSVLLVPLRIAAGDLEATLSLGTFAGFLDEEGVLGRTLRGIDLFELWAFAVMGIGIGKLDPDRGVVGPTLVLWGLAVVYAVAAAFIATTIMG